MCLTNKNYGHVLSIPIRRHAGQIDEPLVLFEAGNSIEVFRVQVKVKYMK